MVTAPSPLVWPRQCCASQRTATSVSTPVTGCSHTPVSPPRPLTWRRPPRQPGSNLGTRPKSRGLAHCCAQNSGPRRSEEHTSELQSRQYLVCRLLLEKKKE